MSKLDDLTKRIDDLQAVVMQQNAEIKSLCSEMIYNYVDSNMPEFARPIIAALVHVGVIKGINDKGELGFKYSDLRSIVIDYRAGAYDKALNVTRDASGNITSSPTVEAFKKELGL